MSSSLDPDQNHHSVGPDLGPNCLQKIIRLQLAGKELNDLSEKLGIQGIELGIGEIF